MLCKLYSEDIFLNLIWLTLFKTCSITYACHRIPIWKFVVAGSKAVHLWLLLLPDHFHDPDGHHDPEWSSCCHLYLTLSGLWRLCLGWILNQSSRHCTTGEKFDPRKNLPRLAVIIILVIVGRYDYLVVSYELFLALFSSLTPPTQGVSGLHDTATIPFNLFHNFNFSVLKVLSQSYLQDLDYVTIWPIWCIF